jgi:hypothetical protein
MGVITTSRKVNSIKISKVIGDFFIPFSNNMLQGCTTKRISKTSPLIFRMIQYKEDRKAGT